MLTVLLALTACNPERALDPDDDREPIATEEVRTGPATLVTTKRAAPPAARPVSTVPPRRLEGEAIVRNCGDVRFEERATGGYGRGSRGSGPSRPKSAPLKRLTGAPPASSAPLPSAPPPRMGEGSAAIGGAADGLGNLKGSSKAEAPAPVVAEQKRKDSEARPMGEAASSEDASAARPPMTLADDRDRQDIAEEPARNMPVWDYGATVYLSNDDSMSLASAQRLLWAVDSQRHFGIGEVRPHELLNYFSFDTVDPAGNDRFGVLGSAEQEGDTLQLALAVQGANPPRQPLDLSLVIDRSGSMRAEGRMEYVKRGLRLMEENLVAGDRVDLVLFDSGVCTPLEDYVVGRDDASLLRNAIEAIQPRGSTDLDAGLREGYRLQTAHNDEKGERNRRIVLLTDAFLNSGDVDQDLVSEIGERFEKDGIRVTGVGVGREFNDKMLDLITEKGKGAYVYLGSEAVVDRVFGSGFDSMTRTIAHDVQFSIELPDSLAMKKFYGEESSTDPEDVQPINYYADTSQLFLQDLKIKDGRLNTKDRVLFRVRYSDAETGEDQEETFETTLGALIDGETHNLRKAKALMAWTDLLAERAMGDRRCTSLNDYRRAASQVQGDAEIAYVSGITGKMCGVDMSETVAATGVTFKVKVDADQPIPEVKLACEGESWSQRLGGGDSVARFDNAYPGTCDLILSGTVPMSARVEVPVTGGDVRCMLRGGRLNCQ